MVKQAQAHKLSMKRKKEEGRDRGACSGNEREYEGNGGRGLAGCLVRLRYAYYCLPFLAVSRLGAYIVLFLLLVTLFPARPFIVVSSRQKGGTLHNELC